MKNKIFKFVVYAKKNKRRVGTQIKIKKRNQYLDVI